MAPPVNDNFASATVISGANGSVSGTTLDATREAAESSTLRGGTGARSVWYTFTAPSSGWYKFALTNIDYVGGQPTPQPDADLYVFNDGVLTAMTQTNALAECTTSEEAPGSIATAVNLTSGNVYKIRVSSVQNASTVSYDLTWDEISSIAPANDLFANRIDLGSIPVLESDISCLDSIFETSEPINAGGFTVEQSVWYSFTPASTGLYDIRVDGTTVNYEGTWDGGPSPSTPETVTIQIGTGASASAFTELAEFSVDSSRAYTLRTYVSLTSGTEYIIRVACPFVQKTSTINLSYNARASNFDLEIDLAPSAPSNDDFANAEEIFGTSGSTSGTTVSATHEATEPVINSTYEQSVWYKYSPTVTGLYKFIIPYSTLTFQGDGPSISSGSVLYEIFNSDVDTLVEATRSNELPEGFSEDSVSTSPFDVTDGHVYVQLYNGDIYYIKVSSASNAVPVSNDSVCDFDLNWELATGPANDNFADAEEFTTVPQTISGTTLDAAAEDDEVNEYGFGQDQSVWYKFIPASSGIFRFSINNIVDNSLTGSHDMGIAMYEGTALNSLTLLEKNNENEDDVEEIAIRHSLVSGTTYYIKVYTSNATGGFANFTTFDFDINLSEIDSSEPAPSNDDFANAEELGIDPSGVFPGTTISATFEGFESTLGYEQPSVWYHFTISSDRTQTVSLEKTGTDPDWVPYAEIYVDDGSFDIGDDYYNYIGNDFLSETVASTSVDFVAGNYYLAVYNNNFDSSWDDFNLTFEEFVGPAANDNFNDRIHLPKSYKVCVTGSTAGATVEGGEPDVNPGSLDPMPSLWYEWISPNYANEPIDFQIDTLGSTAETYLEVFTGSSFFSPLTLIESDHDSGAGGKSLITLNTNGSFNYKIRVSSPLANWGDFNLNITAQPGGSPPANDNFANAEELVGYDDSTSGTTVGATAECGEGLWDYNDATTNSVWYKWIPPQTGRARIGFSAAGTGDDGLYLALARGTALNNLVQTDFFMDEFGGDDWDYVSVEGGVQYYIIIQGLGGTLDTFDLSIHMSSASPPSNDNPSNSTVISVTPRSGSISPITEGANWDSTGPFAGDFITDSGEDIAVWYKFVATQSGNVTFTMNSSISYNADLSNDLTLDFYHGDSFSDIVSPIAGNIRIPTETVTFNVEAGETYWIAASSTTWTTASSIDYLFTLESNNPDGFEPNPANGTSDFDSTTGTFNGDDIDGEFTAGGGVGYGTIAPFPDGHNPYGWWCRFYVWSSNGEYLYRFGQTQQYIEIFRATKDSGEYHSLYVLGHSNGAQTFAIGKNGAVTDIGYRFSGKNKQNVSGKIRVECGENGVTLDGRNFYRPDDDFSETNTIFQSQPDDQFVTFDFGIRSYPGDGSAYVDLDPEWDIRLSGIKLHDNSAVNIMGSLDQTTKEVTLIEGFSYGELVETDGVSFNAFPDANPPEIIPSPGEYDGFSLDCSRTEDDPVAAVGMGWSISGGIYANRYIDPPTDGYNPGLSFRFYVTEFPSTNIIIGSIFHGGIFSDDFNGTFLYVGTDGTLYIQPSKFSELIPFCFIDLNTYYYIEFQHDIHTRTWATKIWLNDTYMGRFETTSVPASLTTGVPLRPLPPYNYQVGILGAFPSYGFASISMGLQIRDVAITRCLKDRPLGPTIVVKKDLTGVGEHNYPDPDDYEANATELAFNNDFSGGTDAAGQPHYWTGYDRHDTGVPGGAMKLNYLFQQFADSLVTLASDGSGPPGHTGENALQIEAVDSGAEAAYVFGGAVDPPVDLTHAYTQKDTLSAQFWIKGIAGQRVSMRAESGIGGWSGFNSHVMNGSWERVRTYLVPQSTWPGSDGISCVILSFADSSPGDTFLVKDFHLYTNAEYNPPNFWESENNGATTIRVPLGDTDSWELIDDFPATDNADQIYLNTDILSTMVKGGEGDGKSHLPPMFSDAYLEYTHGTVGSEQALLGARLLIAIKGYNGPSDFTGIADFETYIMAGDFNLSEGNEDGAYRFLGTFRARTHIDDESQTYYAVNIPLPPGAGEWTIDKWNAFRSRIGFHDDIFSNSTEILGDWTNSGLIEGLTAEVITYDRKLFPPPCKRPVDLSRIRFRAFEQNDID